MFPSVYSYRQANLWEEKESIIEGVGENALSISQLPANMACTRNLVLSGGGSLIAGLRDALKEQLKTNLLAPEDPIFSNALGFYKMGQMLYG